MSDPPPGYRPPPNYVAVHEDALELLVGAARQYIRMADGSSLAARGGPELAVAVDWCGRLVGCRPVADAVVEADEILAAVEDWLTVPEAAKRTGRTRQAITRAAREGRLRARKSGSRWQIDPQSLERYACSNNPEA